MLTVDTERSKIRHEDHGDSHACAQVSALFSGLPKRLREEGKLMVLQAWFDESGKAASDSPVFLLAGYVGKKEMWESFADEWQCELDRSPKLPYLHAKESQLFRGMSSDERAARLLRFVDIVRKYQPTGITFMIKHHDYQEFFRLIRTHPSFKPADARLFKNPYYPAFPLSQWTTNLINCCKALDRRGF